MKLIECVPNFSEGQDSAKIEQIANEIRSVDGVTLLDVDAGKDTNRTVVTFVGPPEAVLEAVFKSIAKAAQVIDMSTHRGAHARVGATDVCPFIPVSGVTMQECVDLAKSLGERVGKDLGIPVYLYEEAAANPERKNLANIRAGEYEALRQKLQEPQWRPDFGPAQFNAKAGATVIGAREFLIAYNINLNTRDKRIANEIASAIRETGKPMKDADGNVLRDENGEARRTAGKFQACKAVGWYMEDFGRAQISINLTNYRITPPHIVFDECCKLAEALGARVTGSELVGVIPLEAMLQAGRHYLKKQGKAPGVPEAELVHVAVLSLGLSDLYPFEAEKKIIEYQLRSGNKLAGMAIKQFVDLLSTDAPAPGGGSTAALCGALSGALTSMVAALTYGKKGYEDASQQMEELGIATQRLKDEFLADVDRDTEAFNLLMEAMRLPKKSDEEKAARAVAIEAATKEATLVPLDVLRRSLEAANFARQATEMGYKNSLSDAGVAAVTSRAAAEGAFLNVRSNLSGIRDDEFKKKTLAEAEMLWDKVCALSDETIRLVEKGVG